MPVAAVRAQTRQKDLCDADGIRAIQMDSEEMHVKSYRKVLYFNTPTRRAYINITPQVQQCIDESGIKDGLVLVNAMNITASVFVNDDEPGCTMTSRCGSRSLPRKNRTASMNITASRTMRTRTRSGRSWAAKSWLR